MGEQGLSVKAQEFVPAEISKTFVSSVCALRLLVHSIPGVSAQLIARRWKMYVARHPDTEMR